MVSRAISGLIPFARNSRTHSDAQVAQIAASIREFGWTNPLLIDEAGGIIAGHGRLLAARKLYEAGNWPQDWPAAPKPLALRGITYRPAPAAVLLRRNLLIYGLGGVLLPFPCIKAIDLVLTALGVR